VSGSAAPLRAPFRFRLDVQSGVPVYRQLIDQVQGGIATGALSTGDQLPTVRQVAVDLTINPNTVLRAYRELEIREVIETQQGTGTFVAQKKVKPDALERERRMQQIVGEFVARAGAQGFTVAELMAALRDYNNEPDTGTPNGTPGGTTDKKRR
jgi:GntR family transcriptional regulator